MPRLRTPFFELHIQPMFRILDRDHMLFRFDLFDYDKVKANATQIFDRLQLDMPVPDTGGPWPEEWIILFQRWIALGFPRLGAVTGTYKATRRANAIVLHAEGDIPNEKDNVWLQRANISATEAQFYLYREPSTKPGEEGGFDLDENLPLTITKITVIEQNRSVDVPIV